ncbi:protein PROCA1-like [Leucoraja erinacea]|uniref:protein PROCA1-like n=1 Tax=Leucoraja erinaceus TaxID=7782 RepID=UPI00245396DF|nr:protein PROCA1-like [Leucoraja erinacea]
MLRLLLALVFSSTAPCAGSTPQGPGTTLVSGPYCRQLSALPSSLVSVQSSDGAVMVRSLLRADGQVVRCSLVRDQPSIRSFVEDCLHQGLVARAGDLRQHWAADRAACLNFLSRTPDAILGPSAEDARWSPDAGKQPRTDNAPAPRRTKRGFTYPGTLWCGAGNIADTYDHLGEFSETDKCCREHDHCAHVIYPFSSSYGHRNLRLHTLSHCDCDAELKKCLRRVNDTSSRIVGQAFFNVLEVPCFDLTYEEQCVERFWYGWCKRYGHVLVAVPRESVLYDYGGDLIDETDTEMKPGLSSPSASPPWTGATPDPPGQPSTLGQVIHAAEDLLKVMATVTQSSAHGHLPGAAAGEKGARRATPSPAKARGGRRKGGKARRDERGKGGRERARAKLAVKPPTHCRRVWTRRFATRRRTTSLRLRAAAGAMKLPTVTLRIPWI